MENLENLEQENDQKKGKKSGGKGGLIVIIVLLLGAIGIVSWMYFDTDKKLDESKGREEMLDTERNNMLSKLDSIENVLEQIVLDKDSVSDELLLKLKEVKQLKSQVWAAKNANKQKLAEYEKIIEGLRATLKEKYQENYVLGLQNDSLKQVTSEMQAHLDTMKLTQEERDQIINELTEKMEKANVLKAIGLNVSPINSKGKENYKAKKVEKIKASFTLAENYVVDAGARTVYMRITRGDGVVLATSTDNTFKFDEEDILFSSSRDIDYQNSDTKVDVFYKANDDIISGSYKVSVFVDGKEIMHRGRLK